MSVEIKYSATPPPRSLQTAVDSIWRLSGYAGNETSELLFADLRADLVLDRSVVSPFTTTGTPGVTVAGAFDRPVRVSIRGEIDVVGIRFLPGATTWALGIPGREIRNLAVDSKEVFGRKINDELHGLLRTRTLSMNRLIAWVEQNFAAGYNPTVGRVLSTVHALASGTSLSAIADDLNMSLRHLERVFGTSVGVTLQSAAGILRVQRGLHLLRLNPSEQLAGVLVAAGYSDQAHGTRDVRTYTGMTPRQFRVSSSAIMTGFIGVE